MKLIVLIMAGGKGNRFWPLSSPALPKQFLSLTGGRETLLQQTVKRVSWMVDSEDIYIITGSQYSELVKKQVPEIPAENILYEPLARDTAPALGYAVEWLMGVYQEAVLVTIPSDHYVERVEEWAQAVLEACRVAEKREGCVLIGITPTRPETGYGYILPGSVFSDQGYYWKVQKFIEKPDADLAGKLLREGDWYWNSGMFVWRLSLVKKLMQELLPRTAKQIQDVIRQMKESGICPDQAAVTEGIRNIFEQISPISIDYGLVERIKEVFLVPGSFDWDDVGSWEALERLFPKDEKGNVNPRGATLVDTENCIVECSGECNLIVGLEDAVVASHNGRLLVCGKKHLPGLKKVLNSLEVAEENSRGKDWEGVKTVEKPWGREIWWALNSRYAAKILEITGGKSTSYHRHRRKHETFYIEVGKGRIVLPDRIEELYPGRVVVLEPGIPHRVVGYTDLRLFEVSTPEMEDVERLQDYYGRADNDK